MLQIRRELHPLAIQLLKAGNRGRSVRHEFVTESGLDGLLKAIESGRITTQSKEHEIRLCVRCRKIDGHRRQSRTRDRETADSHESVRDDNDDPCLVREFEAAIVREWLLDCGASMLVRNKLDRVSVREISRESGRTDEQIRGALKREAKRVEDRGGDLVAFAEGFLAKSKLNYVIVEKVLDRLAVALGCH
jgi:hypothetical protein